jgi:TonB family protein
MRAGALLVSLIGAGLLACSASAPPQVTMVPVPGNPPTQYPAALADSGITGTVIAEVVVDSAGRVVPGTILIVQSAHPLFDAEARRVLEQWRFETVSGQPGSGEQLVRVPFEFYLRQPAAPECDSILRAADRDTRARTGRRLGTVEPRALQLLQHKIPARPRAQQVRTLAEFYVDTAGLVSAQSIRILSTTARPDDAIRDITRFAADMRFRPPMIRGCVFTSLVRHEFQY